MSVLFCSVLCLLFPNYLHYHPMNWPRNLKSNLNMYKRETKQQKGRLKIAYENFYARALVHALHNSKQCSHTHICIKISPQTPQLCCFKKLLRRLLCPTVQFICGDSHTLPVRALHFKTMLTHVYIHTPSQTPQLCCFCFKKLSRLLPCLAVQHLLWRYFLFVPTCFLRVKYAGNCDTWQSKMVNLLMHARLPPFAVPCPT
jgi:hypothetical protein